MLWDWALSHGYRAFIEDLPEDRREEMRRRMRDLPGPGAVMQRANPLLIGRKSSVHRPYDHGITI